MPELIDESIRLQVLLERVKAGEDRRIDTFLREVDKELRERLTRASVTPTQRGRIEALLGEVRGALDALYDRHSAAFLDRLAELGELVADTEVMSIATALEGGHHLRVRLPRKGSRNLRAFSR